MKPHIDNSRFGSITISGERYEHDVSIGLDRRVKKRKKKLSKAEYGTSHIVSLAEAEHIFEGGAKRLIVGAGQNGMVELSKEAADYFESNSCAVELLPTPKAIALWNSAKKSTIGLFHVTC